MTTPFFIRNIPTHLFPLLLLLQLSFKKRKKEKDIKHGPSINTFSACVPNILKKRIKIKNKINLPI
jgi:hypothetical protein